MTDECRMQIAECRLQNERRGERQFCNRRSALCNLQSRPLPTPCSQLLYQRVVRLSPPPFHFLKICHAQ